jgi:hypothetical protein
MYLENQFFGTHVFPSPALTNHLTTVKSCHIQNLISKRLFRIHRTINRERLPHYDGIYDICEMKEVQRSRAPIYIGLGDVFALWYKRAVRKVECP